jgi:hypothetical protein
MLFGGIGLMVWNAVKPRHIPAPDPRVVAAEICKPGERHESDRGASAYTPGHGYRASVRHYCVDAAGTRREVTGEFVARMMAGAGNTMSAAFAAGMGSMWPTLLTMGGAGMLILGAFVARRRGGGKGPIRIVIRR